MGLLSDLLVSLLPFRVVLWACVIHLALIQTDITLRPCDSRLPSPSYWVRQLNQRRNELKVSA